VTVWNKPGSMVGGTRARGAPESVLLVHGSTTWGDDPVLGFGAQRPLRCAGYRVLAMDRRGYGASPDIDRSDYAVDAEDIAALLAEEGGAHLVGHSYGGVVVMLAAALVPDSVKSLTLIEPGCYQPAVGDPVVDAALAANKEGHMRLPMDLPVEVYLRAATGSVGCRRCPRPRNGCGPLPPRCTRNPAGKPGPGGRAARREMAKAGHTWHVGDRARPVPHAWRRTADRLCPHHRRTDWRAPPHSSQRSSLSARGQPGRGERRAP
jgi:pimeloyl-ACP methyl ester carboxylesterase